MTDEELAENYVLGTLDGVQRARAKIRMVEDRDFAAFIEGWETRLSPLAIDGEVQPPPGAFAAISSRVKDSQIEMPGTITRRNGEGVWIDAAAGLKIKIMHEIPELKRFTFLAKLEAGAEYVDHDHDQDEEIYMIEGDLIIGDIILGPGDFHIARAGKHHPTHRTRTGCLCMITQAMGPV